MLKVKLTSSIFFTKKLEVKMANISEVFTDYIYGELFSCEHYFQLSQNDEITMDSCKPIELIESLR